MLSYNFTDGVGPQSAAGDTSGGLGFPYVMDSTFATDSSGNIVSWNFAVIGFSPSGTLTKGIQTENDSGNVVDSGNFDSGVGDRRGGVSVIQSRCVGGNSRAGAISRSFICLVRGVGFGIRAVQAIVNGGQNIIISPLSGAQRFFRLH